MDNFLLIISSFPTMIYTTSLVVVVGYWMLAICGVVDFEALDLDIDMDVDLDIDGDVSTLTGMAGLLTTLGLTGVPITIVLSFLLLNAWIFCYFISLFISSLPQLMSWIHIVINIGVLIVSFMVSIVLTNAMIRPLRGLFRKVNQVPKSKSLLGLTCRVRSSRVDAEFGEAECQSEGASLIIKVRAMNKDTFSTGDQVVVIEHDKAGDFFWVMSEEDFQKQLN